MSDRCPKCRAEPLPGEPPAGDDFPCWNCGWQPMLADLPVYPEEKK